MVKKCCFFVKLEVFGYIIGCLGIILSVAGIIDVITLQGQSNEKENLFINGSDHSNHIISATDLPIKNSRNDGTKENFCIRDHLPKMERGTSILFEWTFIILLITVSLLWLFGIWKKKSAFLIPLVMCEVVSMIIFGVYFVIFLMVGMKSYHGSLTTLVINYILYGILGVLLFCFSFYIYWNMMSLYNVIENEDENKNILNQQVENAPIENI